jgi:hypothetical protein
MRRALYFLLVALAAALAAAPTSAQQRDPTRAPAGALAPATAASAQAAQRVAPLGEGAAVLVRNGQPHLVVGARMYTQGQKLGPYTIERIGETEVWLRAGKDLQKIPIFSGIERHTATERPTP